MTIDHAGLAVLSGGVIGFVLGATGGGGSILAIPLLVYVLDVKAQPATALSLVVVAASALIGLYQRRESGEVKLKPALIFSVTGTAGAWVGAVGHRFVREEAMLLMFSVLMIVAAWRIWRTGGHSDGRFTGESCAERFPRSCWVKVSLIGVVVGLLTGFFGVGGGFVIVPALMLVLGFPMRMAVSTSLLIIALIAIGGLAGHLHMGQMDWSLTGFLLFGSAMGMTGGSWIAHQVSMVTLAKSFAATTIGVAIVMIIHNGVKLFGGERMNSETGPTDQGLLVFDANENASYALSRTVMELCIFLLLALVVLPTMPAWAAERHMMQPRVPADKLAEARALKSPLSNSSEGIEQGKAIYNGKGTCFTCHGADGDGKGAGGAKLNPLPRNFQHHGFWRHRTEGELFWVIKHGSPGTGMIGFGQVLSDEEIWSLIQYERTFAGMHGPGMRGHREGMGPGSMGGMEGMGHRGRKGGADE